MRIWRIDDEPGCYWVELEGTAAELDAAKAWVRERWGEDRARPYKNNRTRRFNDHVDSRNPDQILLTTIPMFYVEDVILFKLTWG